jgi:tripartite-type tricarboxylate transporter receptor subunit TctC
MASSRSPALPDVPTTAEAGYPKLQSATWFALLAPKGTPVPVLERLNTETNAVLAEPEVRKQLAEMGATPMGGTRQALAELVEHETRKWGQLVREIGVQVQ